jgi:hypothetical protein
VQEISSIAGEAGEIFSSADAQRGYRHAIDEFIEWYCSEPKVD